MTKSIKRSEGMTMKHTHTQNFLAAALVGALAMGSLAGCDRQKP